MVDDRSQSRSQNGVNFRGLNLRGLNLRGFNLRSISRPPSSRGCLAVAGVVLLVMSVVVAGVGFGTAMAGAGELTKVVAVALFVTAMVALAMGMIGDSFRRQD